MAVTFEDLEVWKRSCRLAVQVYESLRNCRDYGLRNQMQRSSVSVASNIAEGYERTPKDFIRFLYISKGSIAELRTQLFIARQIDIIDHETSDLMIDETKQLSRMIQSLIQHHRRKIETEENNNKKRGSK